MATRGSPLHNVDQLWIIFFCFGRSGGSIPPLVLRNFDQTNSATENGTTGVPLHNVDQLWITIVIWNCVAAGLSHHWHYAIVTQSIRQRKMAVHPNGDTGVASTITLNYFLDCVCILELRSGDPRVAILTILR